MSINITDRPEMNVVNVGDELTQDQIDAITGAATPTASNVFATMDDVSVGDFFSIALNEESVAESADGKVYHGMSGGNPTDSNYEGNRIGFENAGLNGYNVLSGNNFYFDPDSLTWYNAGDDAYTYYTATGISKSFGLFELPVMVFGSGNYLPTYSSGYWNTSIDNTTVEAGSFVVNHTDTQLSTQGYVEIGYNDATQNIGVTFHKNGTDYGGPNTYTNTISDFTVDATDYIVPSHRIRIRINGQDYWVAAELITPPPPPE